MKTSLTCFIFLISVASIWAQDPEVRWQKTIGGGDYDSLSHISATADGGYILGGSSKSNISGDKTEDSKGDWDMWVVKTDATGSVLWDKTIGGSREDRLSRIYQTQDGGYFVIGYSESDISGDKAENSKGENDLWILKLNALGNIIWQHTYGGTKNDWLPSGSPTADGGLIITCVSSSGVSGDRTEPLQGYSDAWVLKLDNNGAIEWQKSIGGDRWDYGKEIIQTPDGGYILGSNSNSNISGDKTRNSYDNSNDYWVVKLDAMGTVLWDKTIGGNHPEQIQDIINTNDGGYLLGGSSGGPISGDKTQNGWANWDYWLVKLDSNGNIVWDKTYGGYDEDHVTAVSQLQNGNYLISGWSKGQATGDKTEPSNGGADAWFLSLDPSGELIGQRTIGGNGPDFTTNSIPTSDGGFVVGATSGSNISGGKTEDSKGGYDFWNFKVKSDALGLEDPVFNTSISVYPNPTNGNFSIDLGKEYSNVTIQITDMLGKLISTSKYASAKTIDQEIKGPSGIYLVNVDTNERFSESFKMIKN